jgi:hypothetical protein
VARIVRRTRTTSTKVRVQTNANVTPHRGPASKAVIIKLTSPTSGIDFVQEKVLGQGQQNDESAVEQAKDEQISDFIRGKYKSTTGNDIPIEDKETRFG